MTVWYFNHEGADSPPVAFEPCAQFRAPLDGDLMTCRDCSWWISDHQPGAGE